MRGHTAELEFLSPTTLDDALEHFARGAACSKPARAFAGGTDLMVQLGARPVDVSQGPFVNLSCLAELKTIDVREDAVVLGALTTYAQACAHPVVAAEFPALCLAARATGAPAIQNRGTFAGNIANSSPAADSPPVLMALDASYELTSARGRRFVHADAFHLGYKKTELAPDELLTRIFIPRRNSLETEWRMGYRKVGTRRAQAISKVAFAGALRTRGGMIIDVRLCYASIAPVPLRVRAVENFLRGKPTSASGTGATETDAQAAVALLRSLLCPIDDVRSTADYRKEIACRLLADFLLSESEERSPT
ncbi:MAG: FAD binding domain-containing protein [Silvanigrellales bacterium]|jgi:CO/xanthine dehydrogenase FAD-binding subunit|nr:FAD binding domain-containing protein [Silvanigrellales bacterium]